MRTRVLIGMVVVAAGCGGGEVAPNPPPPPPPPPPTPSSITVQAGADQQGEPGKPLPVRPAVLVRSAAGTPVANVTVTFVVDSGGGSIASASAVTGTDGVATAGEWTLGPALGRHVLTASVASLPPIRIAAVGAFPEIPIATDQPIPTTGGVIRLQRPGTAMDGIELSIPTGAYPQATRWTVSARQAIPLTLPSDAFQVGPAVAIGNGQGYADSVMFLTIPHRAGADAPLAAFYFDSAAAWLEPVPVADQTDSTLTIGVRHFSAAALLTPQAPRPSAAGGAAVPFGGVVIVVVGVKPGLLASRVGTSFKPGVDDWEFVNEGTFGAPGGICAGMSISALYYNFRHKAAAGPLYQRYDAVPGFSDDNPAGIRFASDVQAAYLTAWDGGKFRWLARLKAIATAAGRNVDQLAYRSLTVSMYVTGRAQMVDMRGSTVAHMVVAYESNAGRILIADPNRPGLSRQLTFLGTKFEPLPFAARAKATEVLMTEFAPVGITALTPLATLDAGWRDFEAGRAGSTIFEPIAFQIWDHLTSSWRDVTTDTVTATSDTLITRVNCPTCPYIRVETPPTHRQLSEIFDATGTRLAADRPNGVRGAVLPLTARSTALGFTHRALNSVTSTSPADYEYVGFNWVTVGSILTRISPRGAAADQDSTTVFAVKHRGTHPAGARYRWIFSDGNPPDTVLAVGDSTASYKFRRTGTYGVKVEVENAAGKLIGRDTTTADVSGAAVLAWRLDAIASVAKTDGGMDSVIARPTDAVLFVYRSAVVPPLPGFPTPGAHLQLAPRGGGASLLNFTPGLPTHPVAHTVSNPVQRVQGSFSWSGSPAAGHLVGNGTPLNQTCTRYLGSIEATTSGPTMTGTMRFTVDRLGGCDGGAFNAAYSWTFTATRVR